MLKSVRTGSGTPCPCPQPDSTISPFPQLRLLVTTPTRHPFDGEFPARVVRECFTDNPVPSGGITDRTRRDRPTSFSGRHGRPVLRPCGMVHLAAFAVTRTAKEAVIGLRIRRVDDECVGAWCMGRGGRRGRGRAGGCEGEAIK